MKYPWAVPGRKVVCVNDHRALAGSPPTGFKWRSEVEVVSGQTYTIRSVGVNPFTGHLCLSVAELPKRGDYDFGYFVERFRPLHTIETDVALFAELLTPAPNAPMLPTKEYIPL